MTAWAGMKSFRPKDGPGGPGSSNGWTDFKGEKRGNETHESLTDPSAKLARKGPGQEARLSFGLHAAMENRNGLCVAMSLRAAVGESESKVGVELAADVIGQIQLEFTEWNTRPTAKDITQSVMERTADIAGRVQDG